MSEARVLEDPEFAAPQQPDLPPVIPAHDAMTEARLNGYGWDDILGWIGDATQTALGAGYTQPEIDAHLGYSDPAPLQSDLQLGAQTGFVQPVDPKFESGLPRL